MSQVTAESLLDDVKSYLHINWSDPDTEANLLGMIKRGMVRLQHIAGVPLNFTDDEDLSKELLLDYCRYSNSHALEMFEKNFESELLSLHIMGQVTQEAATDGN